MKKRLPAIITCIGISFQFSIGQGVWTQKANFPSTKRYGAVGFSIGSKGYVGTGYDGNINFGDFWEYNPSSNSWSQKASIPARRAASAFTIGSKGYVTCGISSSGSYFTDILEYDPSSNVWTPKTNFPGAPRYGAAGFTIGNKGYIGCGNEGSAAGPYTNEFWEFDPAANAWTQKTNFPGSARYGLTQMGWGLGNKGFMGFGYSGSFHNDLYEYDQSNNSWTKKANFPGAGRSYGVAFTTCNKYYAGAGQNSGNAKNDIWQYNSSSDTWTQVTSFGGGNRWVLTSFVVNGRAFAGTGYDFANYYNDWWEFTINTPVAITAFSSSICQGSSTTLLASGGTSYLWNTGATSSAIVVAPTASTSYSAADTSLFCNTAGTISITVTTTVPVATLSGTTICAGESAILDALGGGNYLWNGGATTSSITVSPTVTTSYSVTVSIGSCTDAASATVLVNPAPNISITGNILLCKGDTSILTASGGGNYSWNTGQTTGTIAIAPSANTTYSLVASIGNCSDTAIANAFVSPSPLASIISTTVCAGQVATLTASGGNNFMWSNGATTSSITTTGTANSSYSVTVAIGTCSDTASTILIVNPSPAAAAFNDMTITQGESTTLGASGAGTYLWNNSDTGAYITVSPGATTKYCVTVTNSFGCSDSACITVSVKDIDCSFSATGEFFIPNAFSPNGDGENEKIKLLYGNYTCIKTYHFVIYDRWGEKIFETSTPTDEWNGNYKSKTEENAVFTYYMKATLINDKEIIKKGNICVLR